MRLFAPSRLGSSREAGAWRERLSNRPLETRGCVSATSRRDALGIAGAAHAARVPLRGGARLSALFRRSSIGKVNRTRARSQSQRAASCAIKDVHRGSPLGSTQGGHFIHPSWEVGTVILQCQVVTITDFAEKGRKVIMTVSTTVKFDLSPGSREQTRNVYENKA